MASDFDRAAFLAGLETAGREKYRAAELGVALARRNPKRLYFVGQGAPNKLMSVVKYWAERTVRDLVLFLLIRPPSRSTRCSSLCSDPVVLRSRPRGTPG